MNHARTELASVAPSATPNSYMVVFLLALAARQPSPAPRVPFSAHTIATPVKTASLRTMPPKAFIGLPPSSAAAADGTCGLTQEHECRWSYSHGSCSPGGPCHNVDCGLITCSCELTVSSSRPPWRLLDVSSAACPENIDDAFKTTSLRLNPEKNQGCAERARSELQVVRQARDTMLGLVNLNLALGGSCDPWEGSPSPAGVKDAWTRLEEMGGVSQPALLRAWRSARRWAGNLARSLQAKVLPHSRWLLLLGAVVIQSLAVVGVV